MSDVIKTYTIAQHHTAGYKNKLKEKQWNSMGGRNQNLGKYFKNHTSKYHNKRSDGFDSKRERDRYQELLLLQRAGQIKNLQRQVKFELIPTQYKDGKCIFKKTTYVADFTYIQGGKLVVEDSKGYRTEVYNIKKKLMYQVHGIIIKET